MSRSLRNMDKDGNIVILFRHELSNQWCMLDGGFIDCMFTNFSGTWIVEAEEPWKTRLIIIRLHASSSSPWCALLFVILPGNWITNFILSFPIFLKQRQGRLSAWFMRKKFILKEKWRLEKLQKTLTSQEGMWGCSRCLVLWLLVNRPMILCREVLQMLHPLHLR